MYQDGLRMISPEHLSNIPDPLKQLPQWVVWRRESITDEATGETETIKMPRRTHGGGKAKTNDPDTWSTYEQTADTYISTKRYAGIGFIITENDPFTGIDLDKCVDPSGEIQPWAKDIIKRFDSYTEFSPSGTGVHIIIQASKPGPRCRIFTHPQIEVYDKVRFLAITGNIVPGCSNNIQPSANELSIFYTEIFGPPEQELEPTVKRRIMNANPSDLSDWELIEKAKASKISPRFTDLWYGNAGAYNNDLSSATMAFCNDLAFWTVDDSERMDRILRQSGLMRDKWDSRRPQGTWGSMTIQKAINSPHEVYQPDKFSSSKRLDKAISEQDDNARIKVTPVDDEEYSELSSSIDFESLIPPLTYLDSYVEYAKTLTDAPVEFHLAAGLSTVAAALENRVYITAWGQRIYPNLWMLLLAPSGFYRKSTAINIGIRCLRGQCEDVLMPNDFTREKLIEFMDKKPSGLISVYEFGDLLAQMQREYNCGMKEFLTNIYDGHPYKRATKKETSSIVDPSLSILAASTIDWIHDRITEGDVRGGFLARFLFWPSTQKNGWMGLSSVPDTGIMELLQNALGAFNSIEIGSVGFPKSVVDRYNDWNRGHEEEINDKKLPSELQGFYTRMATYVLKIAMIYQVVLDAETPMTLNLESLEYSISLIEYLKTRLLHVIQNELVTTKDARDLKKILEIIEREPGVTRSKLLQNSHFIAKRLDDLLVTLVESRQIIAQKTTQDNAAKKPRQMFYLSDENEEE